MRSVVLASDSRYADYLVWGVFWIDRDEATPFLIECIRRGGAAQKPAVLSLQRLSFVISPQTDDANELVRFWSQWWDQNRATAWDERFAKELRATGVAVYRDATGAISLETLLDACETFPLEPTGRAYEYDPMKQLDVSTLMAMRVSELLCERTGLEVTPWCFPFGYPDESWDGLWDNSADPARTHRLSCAQAWRREIDAAQPGRESDGAPEVKR
jgi:hypothetical protein